MFSTGTTGIKICSSVIFFKIQNIYKMKQLSLQNRYEYTLKFYALYYRFPQFLILRHIMNFDSFFGGRQISLY